MWILLILLTFFLLMECNPPRPSFSLKSFTTQWENVIQIKRLFVENSDLKFQVFFSDFVWFGVFWVSFGWCWVFLDSCNWLLLVLVGYGWLRCIITNAKQVIKKVSKILKYSDIFETTFYFERWIEC